MTLASDLRAARGLIDTPEKWTKHTLIRDDGGTLQRCAVAACYAVGRSYSGKLERALQRQIPLTFGGASNRLPSVARFNDAHTTTHADIMALFDRAIRAAEGTP